MSLTHMLGMAAFVFAAVTLHEWIYNDGTCTRPLGYAGFVGMSYS